MRTDSARKHVLKLLVNRIQSRRGFELVSPSLFLPTINITPQHIHTDWTESHWFLLFRNDDANLEEQMGKGCLFAIDDQHPKILVKQNPRQSIR